MSRQEFYRRQYRQLNPQWQDSVALHRAAVDRATSVQTSILDLGCGSADALAQVYRKARSVYGIDTDIHALQRNPAIQHKLAASGARLPFADATFDVIVLTWVLEHLERPELVFREISRALRPGGNVFFLTPNAWNYNVWIIRMVPNRLHEFFARRLYGRRECETYPVHYRMNTVKQIDAVMGTCGLVRKALILNDDPSYMSFNNPLFACACLLEHVLDRMFRNAARVHLIGMYQKPSEPTERNNLCEQPSHA